MKVWTILLKKETYKQNYSSLFNSNITKNPQSSWYPKLKNIQILKFFLWNNSDPSAGQWRCRVVLWGQWLNIHCQPLVPDYYPSCSKIITCWFCPLFGNNPNGLLIKWFLSTVTLVTQLGIIYLIMMRFNRPDYTFAFTNLLKNKLKSLKVAKWKKDDEGWWRMMKDDEGWWRMMKHDEGWWMMIDFKLIWGFAFWQTNGHLWL